MKGIQSMEEFVGQESVIDAKAVEQCAMKKVL